MDVIIELHSANWYIILYICLINLNQWSDQVNKNRETENIALAESYITSSYWNLPRRC